MIAMLFVAASLALPAMAPQVPQGPPPETVLKIAAHPIYPDGKTRGWSSTDGTTSEESGYLFGGPSPCTAGASVREPDASFPGGLPGYGWRVSGRVLQRQNENVLVEIQWQRLWDQSRRIDNGQKGSMQVSLHVGDRLPLDDIYVPTVAGCEATGMHLEAYAEERYPSPPGAKMRGTSVTSVGRLQGAGAGSGSGVGVATGFGPGVASAAEPVNVDLWLVHTLADGTEEAQRMTIAASPSSSFRFPPITVGTAEGNATVEISGDVSAIVDVSGEKQIRMMVGRVVRDNPALNGIGHSVSAHPMPKPGEVYSFEIPALRAKGEPVKSDRVSLRLRIATKEPE